MTDAFISYSRKDKTFTRKLVDSLQENGKSVWVDWENIPLTADWMQEIEAGIEEADNFVFIITPDSVKSEICLREIQYADKHNKRFVPILHKELEDTEQNRNLHPSISSHNWIFFRDEQDRFDEAKASLIRILETDLEYVKAHTRLLTRAVEWDNRGRDNSFLLRGNELQEAIETAKRGEIREPEITRLQSEYIALSQQAERLRRTLRILTGVVTVAFVTAVVAAGVAFWQFNEAERQREIVQELSLAANSRVALLNDNRDLAISLITSAFDENADDNEVRREAEFALANAAYSPGTSLLFDRHDAQITAVAVSADDRHVLSGDSDGILRFWRREDGEVILTFSADESGPINNIVFPENSRLHIAAVVSDDGIARVWDVRSGQEVSRFEAHTERIEAITFSPDGRTLVTGGDDAIAYAWDAQTGELISEYDRLNGPVVDLDFHPNANIILIMALETAPTLWDFGRNGSRSFSNYLPIGDNLEVGAGVFNSDGTAVLTSFGLDMVYWNIESGELLETFTGHGSYINDIAIDPDDNFAITSAWRENSIRIWDLSRGLQETLFNGHDGVVHRVVVSFDGRHAISASDDETLRVWDLTSGALIRTYDEGPTNDIYGVDYHPNGESVIVAGQYANIYRIELETGDVINQYEGLTERVWTVQYSPDGNFIFAGGDEAVVNMWNANTGEIVHTFRGHTDNVTTLDVSSDGRLLLTGSNDATVGIWDIETGNLIGSLIQFEGALRSVVFSPDNREFVAGAGTLIRLSDVETRGIIRDFVGHTNRVNTLAFSGNGQRLASGGGDGSVRLWNVNTGEVIHVMRGHQGQVRSVEFGQQDRRILSSSADATLRLWDTRTGLEVRRFEGHEEWVNQAVLSPDDRRAVSGAWDETIRTWFIHDVRNLVSWTKENRYVRELTCEESRIYLLETASQCVNE